jgi:hypothetical protein
LIRRIATFGLGISPPPKRGDGSRHYLPLSSDAEADQGAENAEIRCRIGAKSGAAFRRNHLPLSTEIQCRFAPIFARKTQAEEQTGGQGCKDGCHGSDPDDMAQHEAGQNGRCHEKRRRGDRA